jgi:hypothetical protein
MLYDRLQGKRFGLTAWLRFPLRTLVGVDLLALPT